MIPINIKRWRLPSSWRGLTVAQLAERIEKVLREHRGARTPPNDPSSAIG